MAERLGGGLQNHLHRFKSDWNLNINFVLWNIICIFDYMKTIKIYTVIPHFSDVNEVFLSDVKSFTTYEKAEYYLYELKREFGFTHIEITESELEIN